MCLKLAEDSFSSPIPSSSEPSSAERKFCLEDLWKMRAGDEGIV